MPECANQLVYCLWDFFPRNLHNHTKQLGVCTDLKVLAVSEEHMQKEEFTAYTSWVFLSLLLHMCRSCQGSQT